MFTVSEICLTYAGIVVPREYSTTPSGVLIDPWSLTVEGGQPRAGMKAYWLCVHCAKTQNQKYRSESESNQNQAIVGLGRFQTA
jgi:hypothetical protein